MKISRVLAAAIVVAAAPLSGDPMVRADSIRARIW
jgi:hypothetical protein